MMFEGWRVPDNDADWVKYLRDAMTPPYATRRQGDDRPLDWVERFLKEHPEKTKAIGDAFIELLREPDPSRRAQILEQLPSFPDELAERLSKVLADEHVSFRAQSDPFDSSQTLLGRLVRVIDRCVNTTPVSSGAASVLETIDRPQDGWPESFLIAFRSSFPKLLPKLVPTIEKLDADGQKDFAERLALEAATICDQSFDEIGRTASERLRRRIGDAIKDYVRPDPDLLRRYQQLAQKNPTLPAPDTKDRWPDLARRLRLQP